MRSLLSHAFVLSLLATPLQAAQAGQRAALTVVSAGPSGALSDLAQANEIRVTFSEPMVTLGKIPDPVTAPFFRIRPALRGTFRWSGTTILIFTPDPAQKLPFATAYEVTIEADATAISGRRLAAPYTFRFTTPAVQLLSTTWVRRTGRHDSPLQIFLRFNQPVDPDAMLAHVSAAYEPHEFVPPALPSRGAERLKRTEPDGLKRFHDKVSAARAAAGSDRPVPLALATAWDRTRFPPSPDLLVLDTAAVPPPESWIRVTVGPDAPSAQGPAVPGAAQHFTIQVERAFFADGFQCDASCDPSSYNAMRLRGSVHVNDWRTAVSVTDITDPSNEAAVAPPAPKPREAPFDSGEFLSLEDAGFDRQPPVRTWLVRIDPGLTAEDGQTLGYPWMGPVENWRERAFTSFGDGHGVWETSGGPVLPFYARNFLDVTQWIRPLAVSDLMPTINLLRGKRFRQVPPGPGEGRRLGGTPDRVLSHGLDLSAALGVRKTGLVWAGIREGRPVPRSRPWSTGRETSSIVQVTNLGVTVKDSPDNTLVFVTRLDTGEPVGGASVSIVTADETVFWRGTTGPDGVALAPDTRIRNPQRWWDFSFIVIAEKDGDVAYTGSDWNEGLSPWAFGLRYDMTEAEPVLRGAVFSDRGVYRLGEEVHVKAILRRDTARGIRLLEAGTTVHVVVNDGEGREVGRRTVAVNDWSSAEWTMALPSRGSLGTYSISASLREPATPGTPSEDPLEPPGERGDPWERRWDAVTGTFLVAAYRRPEFRVDVTLGVEPAVAGAALTGVISARYLFGAPMAERPVAYKISRERAYGVPPAILEKYPAETYAFGDCCERRREEVEAEELALDGSGQLDVEHVTPPDLGSPYRYTLEADVEDVSRQHIAGRASVLLHPAPWYIGIKRPSYFVEQKDGLSTAIVAVTPEGEVASGVTVRLTLTRTQWHSVRRAEGNGFYSWETTRKEIDAGSWTLTTAADPVAMDAPLASGGSYTLTARAGDSEGRLTVTSLSFYVLGEGYTAWARYDHNRIDLVPERATYSPGETARIMVQSPWESATALVTTEREGIRSYRQIALTSTQQTISVPVSEADIPNVYVSVLLIKGRTKADGDATDGSDPGKPAFRVGYAELKVEDASRRLSVSVAANREEYRPGSAAAVDVVVKDAAGKPAESEVTLWAVDYGVLSLTAFRTPDVLASVYVQKALQVMTSDGRQRIVSRRVLTPKGETDGGGGGSETGASEIRKDFRVLAFWLGSVTTDRAGRATAKLTLPESLTTYRIMAVSGDRESRFGSGESEIRINKPVLLRAAFPRFLAVGDTARFGSVITNQQSAGGKALVTVQSLDPGVLTFGGETKKTIEISGGGTREVRFDAVARAAGRARIRMTVRLGSEGDAFEDSIPVEVLSPRETVAAYGQAAPRARETIEVPRAVVPGAGGLDVQVASTAMVGLSAGAQYLLEYPYGCAEQRASRTLALVYAADLGGAFRLDGIDPVRIRTVVQDATDELREFQCPDGGFAFWKGLCNQPSPYLTSYVLHVLQQAAAFEYRIEPRTIDSAADFLVRALAASPPQNEGWWPAYTAWQAFAVNTLAAGGRNQDSNITRLYQYRDRMPVFALAHLYESMAEGRPADSRLPELARRMSNAVVRDAGGSHVEELNDPYLLWFWNSNVRSTAILLDTYVRHGLDEAAIAPMVRWMLQARKDGRWSDTQENAWALSSLVSYYKKYERETPDFEAVVRLGRTTLLEQRFEGRSTDAVSASLPMSKLASAVKPGESRPLEFTREGSGTLFYSARLQYVNAAPSRQAVDRGIRVRRTYEKLVEGRAEPAAGFAAGDLVRVTLTFDLPAERRYVAVTDPLPAGFEPIESWFATTAAGLAEQQQAEEAGGSWFAWWERGGFDHIERHDDRVQLFATRLSEGRHEFSYVVRATTAGTFSVAPVHAEEMYRPENFGRTEITTVKVTP